ncbi:DUF3265 domain-containing protein [Vibrio metschnikovii]|nr:DUF3265 domain-containing protein [Vibrio metschnikovii]MBC5814843.1 DUF3265 domain-containing protein [Vibrio metschnikovii]
MHLVYESKKYNKQFKQTLNAWHFYYALVLVCKGGMRRLRCCVAHTLTGRYTTYRGNM